jgi:hypothetical protein
MRRGLESMAMERRKVRMGTAMEMAMAMAMRERRRRIERRVRLRRPLCLQLLSLQLLLPCGNKFE